MTKTLTSKTTMLLSPNLTHSTIRHGFFGRKGGVSTGLYTSLNCAYGTGDAPENVMENYETIRRALGANGYCKAHQIHSNIAVIADKAWPREAAPQADALITNVPGLMIGITTADCLPILFADSKAGVVAAAHAGWKGAIGGIIEAIITQMKTFGARDIVAAIGPAIAQQSYEVGPEFRERFMEERAENAVFFIPSARAEHYMFDLKSYAKQRLERAGVCDINILANDTCLEENDFFSYRRSCLRGEPAYGCQFSAITLT